MLYHTIIFVKVESIMFKNKCTVVYVYHDTYHNINIECQKVHNCNCNLPYLSRDVHVVFRGVNDIQLLASYTPSLSL